MENKIIHQVKSYFSGNKFRNNIEYPDNYMHKDLLIRQTYSRANVDMLLIDVSASMEETDYPPTRLDGAKKASCGFISELKGKNPSAHVGIVVFSDNAEIISQPLCVSEYSNKLEDKINRLEPLSSTNTSAGLTLSNQVLNQYNNSNNPRILLLTDGHANEGEDPEPVAEKLKSRGIQLDIIGIGGSPESVNELQLRRMASVVDRELRYWFIRSVSELVRQFQVLALRELK